MVARSLPLSPLNIKLLVLAERASSIRREEGEMGRGHSLVTVSSLTLSSSCLKVKLLALDDRASNMTRKRGEGKRQSQVVPRPSLSLSFEDEACSFKRKGF